MPIRIMHVVDTLGQGGLENGLVNVIQRLDPARFHHTVCTVRGFGVNVSRIPADRVQIMSLGKEASDARIQIPQLARAIRKVGPDILHSRNWAAIEAVVAGYWMHSRALVHSEHGLEAATASGEPWRRRCFRRLAFYLADRVFAVSDQLRHLHASRTGFPAKRIAVIHNGVDTTRFSLDPAKRTEARRQLGIGSNEFCIGCVGNLFAVKDHGTLLEALNAFNAVCKHWRLIAIGQGPELPKLRGFVDTHPEWKDRVAFLGARNDVPQLLNAMDVYVLPSITEGISNSLLEAMATGVPVIVTATGGNTEVVIDGSSGRLFPVGDHRRLADHLLAVERDNNLRHRLGKNAILRAQREFSLDSMVEQYGKLYESVAGASK